MRIALTTKHYMPGFSAMARMSATSPRISLPVVTHRLGSSRALTSSLREYPARRLITPLGMTIKTHKAQGSIVPRLIHASHGHPFRAGMAYIAAELRPTLIAQHHLLKDSADLVAKLRDIELPPDAILFKIDVKNYYMSGTHRCLIDQSAKSVRSHMQESYKTLLDTILTAQWVSTHPGSQTYKVTCGSGMGMACSGEISDSALLHMAELPFILLDNVRQKFRVYMYFRFRDDILIGIGGTKTSRATFINEFRMHTGCFKLDVDEVSPSGVSMLDLWIYRESPDQKRLSTTLYVKPTSIKRFLSSDSMHPDSAHNSWPAAQLARIRRLCGTPADANTRIRNFLCDLAFNNARAPSDFRRPNPVRRSPDSVNQSWCVIPYHVAWRRAGVPACLYSFSARFAPATRSAGMTPLTIRVAWSLGGVHLANSFTQKGGRMGVVEAL